MTGDNLPHIIYYWSMKWIFFLGNNVGKKVGLYLYNIGMSPTILIQNAL